MKVSVFCRVIGVFIIFLGLFLIWGDVVQAPTAPHIHKPIIKPHPPPKKPPVLASRGGGDNAGALFLITAYTAGPESTGKNPGDPAYGITASGTHIKPGDVACPQKFPFGTRFRIESIGTVTCTDRGGAINGNHIDIYIADYNAAIAFGKKILFVEVLQ